MQVNIKKKNTILIELFTNNKKKEGNLDFLEKDL